MIETTVVGSYPQPAWLVDRDKLAARVPRVRAPEIWRVGAPWLPEAQDDAVRLAVADMRELGNRLTKYYHESTISKAIVELFHGQQMAMIVSNAALKNPVSRGAHFRRD